MGRKLLQVESFVGLRYLRSRKSSNFLSKITLISIAGVVVGVWALIVVLSVMEGFEEDLREKIIGTNAHGNVVKIMGTFPEYREVVKNHSGKCPRGGGRQSLYHAGGYDYLRRQRDRRDSQGP